ncbi:MAG: FG-GAP and VCBS repeat-containing protein [Gemmatimonadota bacterium]
MTAGRGGWKRGALCLSLLATPLAGQTPAWQFVRHVEGIPVADTAGRPVPQPFLGGFDVPRPQLIDIDGDGDLDLFIQERGGSVMYFENVGGRFTWRSDRYQDLDVGEWFRFVDLDRDGDVDLMAELRNSYVRVFRNDGSRTMPHFTAMPDSLRDTEGTAIFADRQNILNTVDIDCNGRLDLFIGRVTGTVDRYEEDGHSPDGMLRFRPMAQRWENIEILGGVPGTDGKISRPTRHGANTLAFADIDADGDPDLFWGDFFEPGLLLIENVGTCGLPNLHSSIPTQFPIGAPLLTSGYNAPTFGDVDGDGDLDLVMGVIGGAFQPNRTGVDNLYYVEQTAKGQFAVRTSRLISTIDVGAEAAPTLADVDGDGDLDLLIANKIDPSDNDVGTVTWFENVGTRTAPSYRDRGPLPLTVEFHSSPAVADLDGDGKPDLITGSWRDQVKWYRNTGSLAAPAWTLADSNLVVLTRGSSAAPTLADLDGDGDLDLIVGEASGELNLYRNIGSRTAPKFELVSDKFQDLDVGRRSTPVLADLDGDGKPDLVIGSEDGGLQLWRNVGGPGEIRFVRDSAFAVPTFELSVPAVGDLDGDGDLDLIVGVGSGGVLWFENRTPHR